MIVGMLLAARAGAVQTARLRAAAPWGVRRGQDPCVAIHVVTQGTCWLRTPGAQPLRLEAGDFVLLPNGVGHAVSSHPRGPVVLDDDLFAKRATATEPEVDIAGIGPQVQLLCAGYRSAGTPPASLVAPLPPVLHIPARQSGARPGLAETFHMLADETTTGLPGSQIIIDRLVEILAVHALRSWLPPETPAAWPKSTHDVPVATAVTALHRELHRPWTLDELARRSGLSRATLTRRFTSVVGEPPLSYLRRQRMELAAHRLRDGDDPVAVIAGRVGYNSEFAFSRAFSRTFGVPPARYRKAARQDRPTSSTDAATPEGVVPRSGQVTEHAVESAIAVGEA